MGREPKRGGGNLKAVTIDFWGTLVPDGPVSDERYRLQRLTGIAAILASSGTPVSSRDLERAYAESGRWLARIWQDHRDVPVDRHVTALLGALDPGLPARLSAPLLASLVEAYARPALGVPPAVDRGAAKALEALVRRGLRLGLISNTLRTPGAVLRQVLDRSGLLSAFTVLTFSDECGIRKPAPEIFRLTVRQAGVEPEEAVHVGDDPVLDVAGARAAGMRVIQVAADEAPAGPVRPDAVIASFDELPQALDRLPV